MLKRSVIAADISNLTDARYFASWGVDYLMYDLDHIGINNILEIDEWVEGAKTLVQFAQNNIHLIEEVILRINPYAIGTSDTIVLDKILAHVTDGLVFYNFSRKVEDRMLLITKAHTIDPDTYQIDPNENPLAFAEIEASKSGLNNFLKVNDSSGIVLRGSSEIDTGLKSFENIDKILELLESET